ncbi:MAG: SPOR domain-containing protein, partial [Deltaproteobacteria bacterium]|nr:SPOR domain-containing protein [Deltaproteobacteria bacterium]
MIAKPKPKVECGNGRCNFLTMFLRFEIVVVLLALVGFYCFLSSSSARVPEKPIVSLAELIAPLLPQPEVQPEIGGPQAENPEAVVVREQSVVIAELSPEQVVAQNFQPELLSPVLETTEKKDSSSLIDKSESLPLPARAIVVGEYVLHDNLLQGQARLKSLNFTVKTEIVQQSTPLSRVFLGPFTGRQKALEMMAVARDKGDEPFLQFQDGSYIVVVGSFYLPENVVTWKKLYRSAGLNPGVQKITVKLPHFLLLLDGPG